MSEETSPVFVKFGDRPNQKVPLEWAENMLTELKRTNGQLFGRLLNAAIGIEPKERKQRDSSGNGTPNGTPGAAQQPGRFGRR